MATGKKGLDQVAATADDADMPTSLAGATGAIKIDANTEEEAK